MGTPVFSLTYRYDSFDAETVYAIVPHIRELALAALEPNVFYEPSFCLAASRAFAPHIRFCVVRLAASDTVVAFAPYEVQRGMPWAPAHTRLWVHDFGPCGTPLIHRDHKDALEVMLAGLGQEYGSVMLPECSQTRQFSELLPKAAVRAAMQIVVHNTRERAAIKSNLDGVSYRDTHVVKRRRRALDADWAALDAPKIVFSISSKDVEMALDRFLKLEQAGWKGKAGTAMADTPEFSAFANNAVMGLAAHEGVCFAELYEGRDLLASVILLRQHGHLFAWKTAYDEMRDDVRSGDLLLAKLFDSDEADFLRTNNEMFWCDSCTSPDNVLMNSLWRQRFAFADIGIAPSKKMAGLERVFSYEAAKLAFKKIVKHGLAKIKDKLRG